MFLQECVILFTGGGHIVVTEGGVHVCWGACMVAGGCVVARGHA